MTNKREQGLTLVAEMLSPEVARSLENASSSGEFGAGIGDLALENVFASLWARPGLDRRSRSLVTLGILIALNAGDELGIHFTTALRNGLSVEELEEVVYHATGYAGFPLASAARTVAAKTFRESGLRK